MSTPPFRMEARPTHRLTPCAKMLAEQARGLFGFHNSEDCPNCKREFLYFELWGENGHLQGRIPNTDPETLARVVTSRGNVTISVSKRGFTYLA